MPTTNPRINITVDKKFMGIIAKMAKRDQVSVSAKAKALMLAAMEFEEDVYFSKLAEDRERKATNVKWISHEDAWK